MRNEAEVRGRVGVAERGNRRCERHHAGDGPACGFRQFAVGIEHHVLAVLHDAHVDMESRTCLAFGDFWSEAGIEAVFVGEVANHPFGQHQLVGCVFHVGGEELDFVLLVDAAVEAEIAHFRVAVFDFAADECDVVHALGAETVEFCERCRFMVAFLVYGRIHLRLFVFGSRHIVFELAHRLVRHAGGFGEGFLGLVQRIFRRTFEALAVFVEERAEETQRGQFGERVDEGRAQARYDVQVAAARLDEGEETGAVHTLSGGEDGVEVLFVRDDEVQRFQPAVCGRIHEVDHADAVVLDECGDVGERKFRSRFSDEGLHGVRTYVHFHDVIFYGCICRYYSPAASAAEL